MELILEVISKRNNDRPVKHVSLTVLFYQSTDVIREDPRHDWRHSVVKGLVELAFQEHSVHLFTVFSDVLMGKLLNKCEQLVSIQTD